MKLAIAVLLVCDAGCLPDYFPRRPTNRWIDEAQLIGSWAAIGKHTPTRLQDGNRLQFATEMEIKNSGVCVVRWPDAPTVIGKWGLLHDSIGAGGDTEKNVLQMRIVDGVVTEFSISVENGHLALWRYIGDPDSREFIEFRK